MLRRTTRGLRTREARGFHRGGFCRTCACAVALIVAFVAGARGARADDAPAESPVAAKPVARSDDLDVAEARVTYVEDLDLLVFEQVLKGGAGKTLPHRRGGLNGAPMLAYLFPTTLAPNDVGFASGSGTVALAVTAHPDFDDTPLWDENDDGRYDDDGAVWHAHWLLLTPDKRVAGDLSVKEREPSDANVVPPTAPDVPLYVDSPGFGVHVSGDTLRVLVPAPRVNRKTSFQYDAVTAYLQYSTASGTPTLGVYELYDVLSGDMKLPYTVKRG